MKIYHLKQQHEIPFGIEATPQYKNNTVRSQMLLANFIKSHPGLPVLIEGLYEDYKFEESCSEASSLVKKVFPNGIPDKFEDLTEPQKEGLYAFGAVRTLFILQIIPAIYKSIHKDESEKIDREIEAGNYSLISHVRETEAINCVIETAEGTGQDSVILVFGGAHNFGEKCKARGIELVEVECRVLVTAADWAHNFGEKCKARGIESVEVECGVLATAPDWPPAITTPSASECPTDFEVQLPQSAAQISLFARPSTIDILDARLSEYPGDIAARLERARILETTGFNKKALKDYEYVNAEYPDNPVARNALIRLVKGETAADSITTASPGPGV